MSVKGLSCKSTCFFERYSVINLQNCKFAFCSLKTEINRAFAAFLPVSLL